MKDTLGWLGVLLTMVVVSLSLVLPANAVNRTGHKSTIAGLTRASFSLAKVYGAVTPEQTEEDRNPFRYAPINKVENFGASLPDGYRQKMDFPSLTLEGVLLRRSGKRAFVRFHDDRRSMGVGDEVENGYSVASIDKDSIVVASPWGDSRRYYVTP